MMSFSQVLERERCRWTPFRQALSKEDQKAFDRRQALNKGPPHSRFFTCAFPFMSAPRSACRFPRLMARARVSSSDELSTQHKTALRVVSSFRHMASLSYH